MHLSFKEIRLSLLTLLSTYPQRGRERRDFSPAPPSVAGRDRRAKSRSSRSTLWISLPPLSMSNPTAPFAISPPKLHHGFAGCMYSPSLGHEHIPLEVSQSMDESHGLMRGSRLLRDGRNPSGAGGFPISLVLCEHPVSCLSQMPRHRDNRLGVSLALHDPMVKLDDMAVGHPSLMDHDGIGGFNKSPFQITIHIRTDLPIIGLATTGFDLRDGTGIAGQLRCTGKSLDLPDFQHDHDCQNRPHSGQAHQKLHLRSFLDELLDSLLRALNLLQNSIQQLQVFLNRTLRLWGQFVQTISKQAPARYAKQIAHLIYLNPIFGQRRL